MAHRMLLPAEALLLGLSTIVVAQGPRLFSRELVGVVACGKQE